MALSLNAYLYFLAFFFGLFGFGWVIGRFLLGIKQILDVSMS